VVGAPEVGTGAGKNFCWYLAYTDAREI